MKKKQIFAGTIFMIVVLFCLVLWFVYKSGIVEEEIFVTCSLSFFSLLVSVLSAVFVVIQLRDTKNIQEAEFIVNLNQAFVSNEQYAAVYTKLENRSGQEEALTYIEISNYLTFFETMYILLMENVVEIKVMDDLFGYRFFLAVHNEEVHRMKLVSAPGNFKNIYKLEKIWMDYRKERAIPIFREENCLQAACKRAGKEKEYAAIISDKGGK